MKKTFSILLAMLLLSMLVPAAAAFASPIGRVLPDVELELHELIGQAVAEYEALLSASCKMDDSAVRMLDDEGVITGFYLSDSGFSLYGYAVNGRQPNDFAKRMEDDGWTTLQDQFEGGLRFYTFEKAAEDGMYTFRLHSCDGVITSVSLRKDPLSVAYEAEYLNAEELYVKGYAYEMGENVTQNASKALEYYLYASEKNHAGACERIGQIYRFGKSVKQDPEEAITWFCKSAELGHPEALCSIAEMYMNGQGVECNHETAMYWYEYAAEQGSTKAQYLAGRHYYEGKIVNRDLEKARELLMLGGEDKRPGAIELLKKIDEAEKQ